MTRARPREADVTSGDRKNPSRRFDPVVVGRLDRAREFDRGTPVYVTGMTAAQLREALGLP